MGFKFKKWQDRQEMDVLRQRYGENANLIMRSRQPVSKPKKKPVHAFSHLFGKEFKVKELNLPSFSTSQKPIRSFGITEAQKIQLAMRNAARLKTRLDD